MLDLTKDSRINDVVLEADKLSFEANGKNLLDCVSFELLRGGITAVIGPNGAGKSLLLRLCHGLIRPGSGHVKWRDSDSGGTKRHAMVFQNPIMLRRSAKANITHALSAIGISGSLKEHQAHIALERFGLLAFAEIPARHMSGGEQQRLAIARAWALSPDVIFLDEPCSQLDPGATYQIEQMLLSLAADGVTLMMATHDLGQARRLARNILFLNRGVLVEHGSAIEFFAAPQSAEARSFIAGDLFW